MVFPIINGKDKGFTFIELMIVLTVVSLLLTIALPRYFSGLQRAKEAVLHQDLRTLRDAIDQYYSDKGSYPHSLETLVEKKYLRTIPVDPVTERADTWVVIPPQDRSAGVYDIKSGAQGYSNDGSAYRDW